jgi:hypothetical protein
VSRNNLAQAVKDLEDASDLHPDARKQLVQRVKFYRAQYEAEKAGVNAAGHVVRDSYGGRIERQKDGFINYDPAEDIRKISEELERAHKQSGKGPSRLEKIILVMTDKLREFSTTDQILKKNRNALLSYFGCDESGNRKEEIAETSRRVNRTIGNWLKLQQAFNKRVSRQGKVLVLSDFEHSPFCVAPSTPGQKEYMLEDGGVLAEFNGANNSNIEKDQSFETDTRGKRTLLIVSRNPIAKLPATTKIEMNISPVDQEEAEIVVRHLLAPYARRAKNITFCNMLSDIDDKFEANPNPAQKAVAQRSVASNLAAMENELGRVAFDTKDQMEQMVIGMGQKKAIQCVSLALANSQDLAKDGDGNIVSLNIDDTKLLKHMKDIVNTKASEEAIGISIEEPGVTWSEYVAKESKWAQAVRSVGYLGRHLDTLKIQIIRAQGQIAKNNGLIQYGGQSAQSVKELEALNEELREKIKMWTVDRTVARRNMIHVYLLYGDPGTGKSVFAEALADLVGCMVRNVDVSGQKNKWLGATEANTKALFKSMLNCRGVVFLDRKSVG